MATIKDVEPWLYQDIVLHVALLVLFVVAIITMLAGWCFVDTITRFYYRNKVL